MKRNTITDLPKIDLGEVYSHEMRIRITRSEKSRRDLIVRLAKDMTRFAHAVKANADRGGSYALHDAASAAADYIDAAGKLSDSLRSSDPHQDVFVAKHAKGLLYEGIPYVYDNGRSPWE